MYFSSASAAKEFLANQSVQLAHTQTILAIQKELGVKNFNALLKVYYATKTAQKEALRAVKGGKKCTQVRFVELCEIYKDALQYRQNVKSAKRALYPNSKSPRTNCSVFSWSPRTSSEKLNNKIERDLAITSGKGRGLAFAKQKRMEIITKIIDREVVPSVSGSTSIGITLVTDPEQVNYSSSTEKGATYSRRCTYRKTDLHVSVQIPAQWYSRVYKRDLYKIDGMFNLDVSTPLHGNYGEGVEVFAATWLVDSRGTSKAVIRGFIARRGGMSFHGKTLASAVQGLARKYEIQSLLSLEKNEIIERAKRVNGLVHLSDSYAVGNCEWGTLDFCVRHNINVTGNNPAITVKELAQKVALEPRREALAVLARAISKSKQTA